ncbi:hypothetical protein PAPPERLAPAPP_04340 [Brevundimonas phage vB_BpoS-Papperlapapp]|uniref:Uncharacterized protein n=2 Tax=Marchewkavirus TaxID=3425052 RepID=A0A9E7SJ86_9CAUD|nr:hypothetical protein KABACHOK_02720 [Brevundimonas phage vB_BpoS-Kabachok]USN14803.1 hypothetical protein DOMOVOI_03290 [Brevundimonas phage vB_BpoS-Domovoi]USN16175.1 hypothetical protein PAPPERLAPAPP_04340 [Brevundimonas phage vB_BpoS-Papperlapapp]
MTKTAAVTPLALVPAEPAAPMSASERARASAAVAKADAQAALENLQAKIEACIAEARDLSTVDTIPEAVRTEINKFAGNSAGSLDAISRAR